MTDEHAWFRDHLADHLLDLLDETGRARLLAHASACAECKGLLDAALNERPDAWLGADHPTPATLVRWHREAAGFEAAEAKMVREHLDSCGSCRADLAELSGERAIRAVVGPPVPTRIHGAIGRRPVRGWAIGAISGSLATAAAFLIVWPRSQMPAGAPTQPTGFTTPTQTPSASTAAFLSVAEPVQVESARRGGSDTARIALGSAPIIPIRIPTLFVADSTRLDIRLLAEDDSLVASRELVAGSAQRAVLMLDVRAMRPGPYTLSVSWQEGGLDHVRHYPIAVMATQPNP